MHRTYWSLYYLAGYAIPSGLMLLLAPDLATRLLQSNVVYDEAPLRLAGLALLALGMFVVQMIRHRVEVLYSTTLAVRSVLSVALLALFVSTGNPFFAVVLAIVLVGFVLTGIAYTLDRRDLAARPALA